MVAASAHKQQQTLKHQETLGVTVSNHLLQWVCCQGGALR
jgi:hypothetical protein